VAAFVVAAALYVVAVSNTAYELTSPLSLPHHVAFRKFYAVCAFSTVGFLCERSAIPRLGGFVGTALLVGLYSYAIEIGQIVIDGSTETFFQHGFDVASGVLGGVLGTALVRVLVWRSPLSFRQIIAIATLIALIIVAFFPTYGRASAAVLETNTDWVLPAHAYDGNRYVRESRIDRNNVGELRLAWIFHYPDDSTIEAAPIERQGTLYVTSGNDGVYAIDARTGRERWRYIHHVAHTVGLWVNRGAALLDGRIYFGTLDGHLIALDARDGHVLWDILGSHDPNHSYYAVAPVPFKNLILIAPSAGVWGGAGYVTAFSATTGKRVWEWYTIPRPGEAGHETWGPGDAWKTGGGSIWGGFTIDPATNTLYVDIGNPQPAFSGKARPGANLYTCSMVALDISGPRPRVRWYHQFTAHDVHDWDAAAPPVLFTGDVAGTRRALVATADKVGNFWLLDPRDGRVLEHAVVSLQKNVDVAPSAKGILTCPGTNGGVEYNGGSYLPETNAFYVPSLDQCATFATGSVTNEADRELDLGGPIPIVAGPSTGWMNAIDIGTGRFLWRRKLALPEIGGALSFGTGLVFSGQLDGEFDAYDAKTGTILWKYSTGSTIAAPPATYTIGGKEYVVVGSGNPTGNFALPGLPATNAGAMISAFTLADKLTK
jgi:alcohol dehydrogenase (cytochrome c)